MSATLLSEKKGYYLIEGQTIVFMETDKTRKSKKVIDSFMAYLYSLKPRQEQLSSYIKNETIRNYIAYMIIDTTLSHKVTDNGTEYMELKNKYETCCYPLPLTDETKFVLI